ncbi:MAG: hypothetical protein ACP5VS_02675, partial [Desulfomonilaceae bacterium]
MGKVRLGPIALALVIFLVLFAGFCADKKAVAGDKSSPSKGSQMALSTVKTADSRSITKPRTPRLKSHRLKLSQTTSRSLATPEESSQHESKYLKIEKKTLESMDSILNENLSPIKKRVNSGIKLSLPQAIEIAIGRNLNMANSRLAVKEKEYQRREAYSDFFPTINYEYIVTMDRYWNPLFELGLSGVNGSRYSDSQQQVRLENVWDQAPAGNKPFAYPN